jgi:hypothetical protein
MLACGHDRAPFGAPLCVHLSTRREPLIYFRWYTGSGLETELLCKACLDERQQGRPVATGVVCEECFEYATTEIGDLEGVHGKPEIRVRSEPIDARLQTTHIPRKAGPVVEIAPINAEADSVWLLLGADGLISRFISGTGECKELARTSVASEPAHKPWGRHILKRRLHASWDGEFAAVVNDYGRYGQIIDLRTGRVTLALDGGGYHPETVPFSFAFGKVNGRIVAIHRTDWNRLDVSDPSTGALLTGRSPTSYRRKEERPAHYLDYFHGALHMSPNGVRIADDGWVWAPVGMPATWNLVPWMSSNVWESEDGPTRKVICARHYYWDRAMAWIDDHRIAIGGLGEDDKVMIDGVRVFEVPAPGDGDVACRADSPWPRELTAFAGPAGSFFSDGQVLFSSDQSGLSRWDVNEGCRTGHLHGFKPTHHHRGARELVQNIDDALVRWTIDNGQA